MDTAEELSTNQPANVISFCAGYGGIERGLDLAGINHRVIAYVEIEAFAVANLVAKMESGELDAAPVWTDLKTFPAHLFRDCVDIITGGYPCQPFSVAGKAQAFDDPRHLFPYILDHVRTIRPSQCFFENVEGHINRGLESVLHDLEGTGYDSTWGIFSAEEVGAPHQRKRIFILGNAKHHGLASSEIRRGIEETSDNNEGRESKASKSSGASERKVDGDLCGEEISASISDTNGHPLRDIEQRTTGGWDNIQAGGETQSGIDGEAQPMADSDNKRLGRWSKKTRREERSSTERYSESNVADTTGIGIQGLRSSGQQEPHPHGQAQLPVREGERPSPTDWLPEPNVGRVVDGCPDRVDRIRLLGNGVVPQTAAKAWTTLNKRLEEI